MAKTNYYHHIKRILDNDLLRKGESTIGYLLIIGAKNMDMLINDMTKGEMQIAIKDAIKSMKL